MCQKYFCCLWEGGGQGLRSAGFFSAGTKGTNQCSTVKVRPRFIFPGQLSLQRSSTTDQSLASQIPKMNCAHNGCTICQIKMSASSNFFNHPLLFCLSSLLIYLFNNNSILECKYHVKAKARMFDEKKKANVSSFTPELFAEYHLVHRQLQIC